MYAESILFAVAGVLLTLVDILMWQRMPLGLPVAWDVFVYTLMAFLIVQPLAMFYLAYKSLPRNR